MSIYKVFDSFGILYKTRNPRKSFRNLFSSAVLPILRKQDPQDPRVRADLYGEAR